MARIATLSPQDIEGYSYYTIVRDTAGLYGVETILFPTSLVDGDKIIAYSEDVLLDNIITLSKLIDSDKISTILLIDPMTRFENFYREIHGLKMKYRRINIVSATEYFFSIDKPIHTLLRLDVDAYLSNTILNTDIAVIDPIYVSKTTGAEVENIDFFTSLLKELGKEYGVSKQLYSYYVSVNDIYLVGVDYEKDLSKKVKLVEESIKASPEIIVYLSAISSKDLIIHGLTYLISSIIASKIETTNTYSLDEVLEDTVKLVSNTIQYWPQVKTGDKTITYPKPSESISVNAYRYEALTILKKALRIIVENNDVFYKYVQTTGSNILQSIPPRYIRSTNDIASPHRLFKGPYGEIIVVGEPEFGQSRFLSRILYLSMRVNRNISALMSISYDENILELASKIGNKPVRIDVKTRKGRSVKRLEELVEEALIEQLPKIKDRKPPVILYQEGAIGLEPAIYIMDINALRLVKRIIEYDKIIRTLPT